MSDKRKLTPEQVEQLNRNAEEMAKSGAAPEEIEAMGAAYFEKFASVEGDDINFTEGSEEPSQPSTATTSEEPLQQQETGGTTPAKPSVLTDNLPVGVASREEIISKMTNPYLKGQEQILLSAENEKKELISQLPVAETQEKLYKIYQPIAQQKQQELQEKYAAGEITLEDANTELNSLLEEIDRQVQERLQVNPELRDQLRDINKSVNDKALAELNSLEKGRQEAANLAYEQQLKELTPLESLGNSLYNSAILTAAIPSKVMLIGEQLGENFMIDLPLALYGAFNGIEISDESKAILREGTQSVSTQTSAYKEIQDLEAKLKPTLPFLDNVTEGEVAKASAAAVGVAVDFLRSIVTGVGTLGMSSAGEIGAPMYIDAVKAKAEETGKTPEQVIVEDIEDETTALFSAGLASSAEYVGLGSAAKLLKNSLFKGATEKVVKENSDKLVTAAKDVLKASTVETGTEVFQGSVESANKAALENGGIGTDTGRKAFLKELINATVSKEAAETGASTFAGSLLLFGVGKGAGRLRKAKAIVEKPTDALTDEEINEILDRSKDMESFSQDIAGLYQAGVITEDQYNSAQGKINEVLRSNSELSSDNQNKQESIRLLAERQKLEAELEALHPTQREGKQAEIDAVDKRLKELANPKTQEDAELQETEGKGAEEAPLVTNKEGEVITVYRGGKPTSGVQYYTDDTNLAEGIAEGKGEPVETATVRMANPWTPESLDVNNAPQWMQDWVRNQEEFTSVDEETMAAEEVPMEQALQEIKDMRLAFKSVDLWQSFVNEALKHHDGIIAFDPSEDMAADKKIYIAKSPEQVIRQEDAVQERETEIAEESTISKGVTVEDAPKGAYIDVEMIAGKDGRKLTPEEVLNAVPVEGIEFEVIGNNMLIKLPRELTSSEMMALMKATEQEAIGQLVDGQGKLYAQSEKFLQDYGGEFNPEFFRTPQKTKKYEKGSKAGNRIFNQPLKAVKGIADKYYKRVFGTERPTFKGINKIDEALAKRIADAYDKMINNPNDPEVKRAYQALAKETIDQYKEFIKAGYKIEINNEEPYNNAQEMIDDLRENKRIKIFSTESGFGDEPITKQQRKENPLLRDSGFKDANGNTLLINDVFRAIHDFYGHAELGNGFGPIGEENAWNMHARMFSPLARRAMTSETRGQNSWVNFSGVNDKAFKLRDNARELRKQGKEAEAQELVKQVYEMMKFADQKIGLLPEEFTDLRTPEKQRVDEAIEGIIQKVKDRSPKKANPKDVNKRAFDDALSYLQGSLWYENASDTEREAAVMDLMKLTKQPIKKSMTVKGAIKKAFPTKPETVTQTAIKALNKQIEDFARGMREAAKEQRKVSKNATDLIKELQKSGNITMRQAKALASAAVKVNFASAQSVEEFVHRVKKTIQDVDYNTKLAEANKLRKSLKGLKNSLASDVARLKEFKKINPKLVEDIDTYLATAEGIAAAVMAPRRTAKKVVTPSTLNYEVLDKYLSDTLKEQEKKNKEILEKQYGYLEGMDLTVEEMNEIAELLEEDVDGKLSKERKEEIDQRISSLYTFYKDMLAEKLSSDESSLTPRQKRILTSLKDADISNLPFTEKVKAIKVAENIIQNNDFSAAQQVISGIESSKAVKNQSKGVKFSFKDFRGVKSAYLKEVSSLTQALKYLLKGETSADKFVVDTGITEFDMGVVRAANRIKAFIDEYNTMVKGMVGYNAKENIVKRKVYAFLSRNDGTTPTEISEEFNRRKTIVQETLEFLKTADGNFTEELEKAIEDLNVDAAKAPADLQVDPQNKKIVEFFQNKFEEIFGEHSEVALQVFNKILPQDVAYTPDVYELVDKTGIDFKLTESVYFEDAVDTKESSMLQKVNKPKGLPKGPDGEVSRVLNLDFDASMMRKLEEALYEIETADAVDKMSKTFTTKNLSKVFEPSAAASVKSKVSGYVNDVRSRGKNQKITELEKSTNRVIDLVANYVATKILGKLTQPLTQTVPVYVRSSIKQSFKGIRAMNLVLTGRAPELAEIANKYGTVALRGKQSVVDIDTLKGRMRFSGDFSLKVARALGVRAALGYDKSKKFLTEASEKPLELLLENPDKKIATASWAGYYVDYLYKNKPDFNLQEELESPTLGAIQYANSRVSETQNESQKEKMGDLFKSRKSVNKLIRNVIFPFANFQQNLRTDIYNNATIINSSQASQEDKDKAKVSLAAAIAETATFNIMAMYMRTLSTDAIASMFGIYGDDEEEEVEIILGIPMTKEERKNFYTNIVSDYAPAPYLDKLGLMAIESTNKYIIESVDGDTYDKYKDGLVYAPQNPAEFFLNSGGKFGSAYDIFQDTKLKLDMADDDGTFTKETIFGDTEYPISVTRDDIDLMILLQTLYLTAPLPQEVKKGADIIRKDIEAESKLIKESGKSYK